MKTDASNRDLKVGLFAIGLDIYWPQFQGLEQRLREYTQQVALQLQRPGVQVVNLGLIDTTEKAFTAGHELRKVDVDLVFLYAATYALSSTVLPVVRRAKAPVIVLNLSPGRRTRCAYWPRLRIWYGRSWIQRNRASHLDIAYRFRKNYAFARLSNERWIELDLRRRSHGLVTVISQRNGARSRSRMRRSVWRGLRRSSHFRRN